MSRVLAWRCDSAQEVEFLPRYRRVACASAHHDGSNDNGEGSFDESNFDRCFGDFVAPSGGTEHHVREDVFMLEVRCLEIPDIKIIQTDRVFDARGYFCETFQRSAFAEKGILVDFVQDNQSSSDQVGTIRGLHFQRPPFAQAKLIRVLSGAILDVVVDLRRSSATFGKHLAVKLDSKTGEQLLVPKGFAHGFCTLQPETVVFYKVDQVYAPSHDGGLYWADPALAIEWPVTTVEAQVSPKDRSLPRLDQLTAIFE
ncbi:dTDP-4-dehydrorhamnose 3,5-epimerase [Bradyrhizobium sp. 159]|uniref:dTDP-4-dehydrorhamnose 3,5-epimerase n=1 Tax=Bradyrhizobium sp. 159 TaxID=2782632 RepID=UPI0031FE8B28